MKTTLSPSSGALSQDLAFLLTFLVLAFLQSVHQDQLGQTTWCIHPQHFAI
jgi:hypothetical protein